MTQPKIGLALGGGAARGWAHIGVIQALGEAGIEPDIVCGTSIGALVGGAHVTGRLDELERRSRDLNWIEIVRLVDIRVTRGGLIEGERIMRFLGDIYADAPIESLDRPFAAVAAELATGREVWLREGSLIEAVRASIALPGLFGPVRSGDRWLVDGGLVNPVPVSLCRAMGADLVVAVNLNGDIVGRRAFRRASRPARDEKRQARRELVEKLSEDLPAGMKSAVNLLTDQLLGSDADRPGYFDVIVGSIAIMQDQITRSRLAGEPPDVLLSPRLGAIGLLEFNSAGDAIAEGVNSVRRMLPALKAALGETE